MRKEERPKKKSTIDIAFDQLRAGINRELDQFFRTLKNERIQKAFEKALFPEGPKATTIEPKSILTAVREHVGEDDYLTKCERKILIALSQGGAMSHERLAIRAGYSAKSGGFMQALADLRDVEFVRGGGDEIVVTVEGLAALGEHESLPEDGDELFAWWVQRRKKGEQEILRGLRELGEANHVELAKHVGKSSKSGGFMQALADLRKLGLIEGNGKAIRLAKELRG